MRCTHTFRIYNNLDRAEYPHGLEVPCGKCFSCRMHRANEWSMRMTHELMYWKKATFLTLTYDPKFLPYIQRDEGIYSTIRYSDVQLFWKRLRKRLGERKIKYFCCSEYGKKGRPHYHAIVFGLNRLDYNIILNSWKLGFIYLEDVNIRTIQYVSGYIQKQHYDNSMRNTLKDYGIELPFSRKSQGLGKSYAVQRRHVFEHRQYITDIEGNKRSIPRYYLHVTGLDEDDNFKDKVQSRQKELQAEKFKLALGIDDLDDEIFADYIEKTRDYWVLAEPYLKFKHKVIRQEYRNHKWKSSFAPTRHAVID